jgi:hypothetical protein
MYDKGDAAFFKQVNHAYQTVAATTTNHQPLLLVYPPRVSTRRVSYDSLDFTDGATMLGGMLTIPSNPAKLLRSHYLHI